MDSPLSVVDKSHREENGKSGLPPEMGRLSPADNVPEQAKMHLQSFTGNASCNFQSIPISSNMKAFLSSRPPLGGTVIHSNLAAKVRHIDGLAFHNTLMTVGSSAQVDTSIITDSMGKDSSSSGLNAGPCKGSQ